MMETINHYINHVGLISTGVGLAIIKRDSWLDNPMFYVKGVIILAAVSLIFNFVYEVLIKKKDREIKAAT